MVMRIGNPPVIVLMTDFGLTDTFVGQMKGIMLSITPAAHIIGAPWAAEWGTGVDVAGV